MKLEIFDKNKLDSLDLDSKEEIEQYLDCLIGDFYQDSAPIYYTTLSINEINNNVTNIILDDIKKNKENLSIIVKMANLQNDLIKKIQLYKDEFFMLYELKSKLQYTDEYIEKNKTIFDKL